MIRDKYCTNAPNVKATATERNIAKITVNAFSVFNNSAKVSPSGPIAIFINANAKVPPNSSNTIDTVVDVGIPNVLNTSSRTTSVTITARKIHINSLK